MTENWSLRLPRTFGISYESKSGLPEEIHSKFEVLLLIL